MRIRLLKIKNWKILKSENLIRRENPSFPLRFAEGCTFGTWKKSLSERTGRASWRIEENKVVLL